MKRIFTSTILASFLSFYASAESLSAITIPVQGSIRVNSIGVYQYSFQVKDLQDLFMQCRQFIDKNNIPYVNFVELSVNYNPIYLKGIPSHHKVNQICIGFTDTARRISDLKSSIANSVMVVGRISDSRWWGNSIDFVFTGTNKSELFNQCTSLLNSNNFKLAKRIDVITNFNTDEKRTISGYWTSTLDVCTKTIESAFLDKK